MQAAGVARALRRRAHLAGTRSRVSPPHADVAVQRLRIGLQFGRRRHGERAPVGDAYPLVRGALAAGAAAARSMRGRRLIRAAYLSLQNQTTAVIPEVHFPSQRRSP